MRLIVFGASGNCGGFLVRQAAERGHQVTAVVRGAWEAPSGVKVARGDVLDAGFVAGVVGGHDAVASCVGMRYRHPFAKRESPDDFTSRATSCIVAGMKAVGMRRLCIISAAGVGDSRPGLNLMMRVMLRISNVGIAYADMELVEEVLAKSGLEWQAVRPTTLTHRPASGKVRVVQRYPMTATIPRQDVAAFMLAELEKPAFSTRRPLITVT
jgi:putative NADH-flavin reductase